jgi:hypothetical protein
MDFLDIDLIISILKHIFIVSLIISLVLTIIGALALKYLYKFIPLLSLFLIYFWVIFRVVIAFNLIKFTYMYLHLEIPIFISGISTLTGTFLVGYLISKALEKNYGVSSKFPGPGFKSISIAYIFLLALILIAAFITN